MGLVTFPNYWTYPGTSCETKRALNFDNLQAVKRLLKPAARVLAARLSLSLHDHPTTNTFMVMFSFHFLRSGLARYPPQVLQSFFASCSIYLRSRVGSPTEMTI